MYFGCRFVLGVVSSEQTGTYISVGSEVYTVWGSKKTEGNFIQEINEMCVKEKKKDKKDVEADIFLL